MRLSNTYFKYLELYMKHNEDIKKARKDYQYNYLGFLRAFYSKGHSTTIFENCICPLYLKTVFVMKLSNSHYKVIEFYFKHEQAIKQANKEATRAVSASNYRDIFWRIMISLRHTSVYVDFCCCSVAYRSIT